MVDNQRCKKDFEREVIFVQKVYNECTITDCPIYRTPIPTCQPIAVNIVECQIADVVTEGTIDGPGEVSIVVTFTLNIEYTDLNGDIQFVQQTAQYRRRGIRLEGAQSGTDVVILPLIRCLNCRPVDGGTVIECDVGIYFVVKIVAWVQLELLGRFAPEPPECEQVSPLGCPEWFELAESGAFWPPFPPQPQRPHR